MVKWTVNTWDKTTEYDINKIDGNLVNTQLQ